MTLMDRCSGSPDTHRSAQHAAMVSYDDNVKNLCPSLLELAGRWRVDGIRVAKRPTLANIAVPQVYIPIEGDRSDCRSPSVSRLLLGTTNLLMMRL